MSKDNIQFGGGLSQDTNYNNQPKNTTRFVLNGINNTTDGDRGFISNENSNELYASLPQGYTPLGSVYIGDGETLIWSVCDRNITSEIGIMKDGYTRVVNDFYSTDKLNFDINHQIQGIYRLRRGCNKTVYWVDNFNRPRYLDLNNLNHYINKDGVWEGKLFSLQKEYNNIPLFADISVMGTNGNLKPGSYNIAVQYIDDDMNSTEWITSSSIIIIYNDLASSNYSKIHGSIVSDESYYRFGNTSKAIKVSLDNLDNSFNFYRLALIGANSGNGEINDVGYSEMIPTSQTTFVLTGNNTLTKGSVNEIMVDDVVINKAATIEQLENRLILGGVSHDSLDYCSLQKYASRITSDCITKTISVGDARYIDDPKHPLHMIDAMGYMQGEIYSFGILYVFEDGSKSPVFHIPGKSNQIDSSSVFSPGENVFPMDNKMNTINAIYTDNSNCSLTDNYWGKDSEGASLKDNHVRHHRFPLRTGINAQLVKKYGQQEILIRWRLSLNIRGNLITPTPCPVLDNNCEDDDVNIFTIKVTYKVNGETFFFTKKINSSDYINDDDSEYINIWSNSRYHMNDNHFDDIVIEISDNNGNYHDVTLFDMSAYWHDNPVFTTIGNGIEVYRNNNRYETNILGIKFSNIELPDISLTHGKQIIGYHIVRNAREERDKTILDSAVLLPTMNYDGYVSQGLLSPTTENVDADINQNTFGLLHMEHKFNGHEYLNYDEIIHQGSFVRNEIHRGKITYNDVYEGTSYNKDDHSNDNDDADDIDYKPNTKGLDGWSLDIISRNAEVLHINDISTTYNSSDINEKFYLDALDYHEHDGKEIFNIATDNKIGGIIFNNNIQTNGNIPYVLLKKSINDSYFDFRTRGYYKENVNYNKFDDDTISLFNGDTYITPLRYNNTMFWANRVAKREGDTNWWKIGLGINIIAIGIILSIFTEGASLPLVYLGIAIMGGAVLLTASGVQDVYADYAYNIAYDKGLRDTIQDDFTEAMFEYSGTNYFGFSGDGGHGGDGPSDDTIQWVGDALSDLWFESTINTSLRLKMTSNLPSFMNPISYVQSGNNTPINTYHESNISSGIDYTNSNDLRYAYSKMETHLVNKLLTPNADNADSKEYIGIALGELYAINPDYQRSNTQKTFFHLPLEYDCCSGCSEDFPHRILYSEQSFQEELIDNFRKLLPNNYVDIPGEQGSITNIFSINENLFVHTMEGLWMLPKNYQERVTDQVISFIGTGSYFNIPARKIIDDDNGLSCGLQHRWSALKNKYGYFFVSTNNKTIFQFDGKQLHNISNKGLDSWFKNNIPIHNQTYNDNPVSNLGSGFLSTYDNINERVIFTKKEFIESSDVNLGDDYKLCESGGDYPILFSPYSQIIADKADDLWDYVGIEHCRMKFKKVITEIVQEERQITVIEDLPTNTVIFPIFDTTSMTDDDISNIADTLIQWFPEFKASINGGNNDLTLLMPYDNTNNNYPINEFFNEHWINNYPSHAYTEVTSNGFQSNVLLLAFIDESDPDYHHNIDTEISSPMESMTATWISHRDYFINEVYPMFDSFKAINYPIVRNETWCRGYVQHIIGAIEARDLSMAEVNDLTPNANFTSTTWSILKNNLMNNSYAGSPCLRDYGWTYKHDRVSGIGNNDSAECPGDGEHVITPCQFSIDVLEALGELTTVTTETILVDVERQKTIYSYVDGEEIANPFDINNSWTISYDLKTNKWISWHSYLPIFYIHDYNNYYSVNGDFDGIWKHNIKHSYQKFYNKHNPFIIEYISNNNPLYDKIWEYLTFMTSASSYDNTNDSLKDERFITFNKGLFYNSRQSSGILNLLVKDIQNESSDYIYQQVQNIAGDTIIIDRNERDWHLNEMRDAVITTSESLFNENIEDIQNEYFIDKVVNDNVIDFDKNWQDFELFRDKYLVIRLIFDTFENIKLTANYSSTDENLSI